MQKYFTKQATMVISWIFQQYKELSKTDFKEESHLTFSWNTLDHIRVSQGWTDSFLWVGNVALE